MIGHQAYQYDFSYSIAFDEPQPASNREKLLLASGNLLLRLKCFRQRETQQIIAGFLRLPIYYKIGKCMLELCTVSTEQKLTKGKKKQQAQKIREQLYNHLQDLSRILSSDKEQYLPLIIILYYVSIKKIMLAEAETQENPYTYFHTIYWELKGQITTNKYLENLMEKTFKKEILAQFEEITLSEMDETNGLSQSFALEKKQSKKNQMLQSFKDIKLLRPDLIMKENLDISKKDISKENAKPNAFKKKMPIIGSKHTFISGSRSPKNHSSILNLLPK